jgi:hypothetical protein
LLKTLLDLRKVVARSARKMMKLRIKGNSLRLRVSRSELERFLTGERIEETIHFSSEPGANLTYALQPASNEAMTGVRYNSQEITVLLSEGHIQEWSDANQVGVYTSVDIGPEGPLDLIVEKDFACLDRSDEENQDTFANPHANENCPKTDDVERR